MKSWVAGAAGGSCCVGPCFVGSMTGVSRNAYQTPRIKRVTVGKSRGELRKKDDNPTVWEKSQKELLRLIIMRRK